MARVVIREKDLTGYYQNDDITDIVYVPGFVDLGTSGDYSAYYNKPTICYTVSEFVSYFGSYPASYTYEKSTESGSNETVTEIDSAYLYAKELLTLGLPVIYHQLNAVQVTSTVAGGVAGWFKSVVVDMFSSTLEIAKEQRNMLKDKGSLNFKYLTTGGYPIIELTGDSTKELTSLSKTCITNILDIASGDGKYKESDDNAISGDEELYVIHGRGDCVALIDTPNDRTLTPLQVRDALNKDSSGAKVLNGTQLEFGAVFMPWGEYSLNATSSLNDTTITEFEFPASFAYLTCLANSIVSYDNWNAIAGVSRGTVSNLNELLIDYILTNTMANRCQGDPETTVSTSKAAISINCITEIRPYGQVIWGNRTLQRADDTKHVTAMGFLNLRNEISDIRKVCYRAARRWMFEQNSSVLWINFAGMITPLLDNMKTGYGISRYELTRSKDTTKHKLYATLRIWPIYAVEYYDVTIEILDEDATVTQG